MSNQNKKENILNAKQISENPFLIKNFHSHSVDEVIKILADKLTDSGRMGEYHIRSQAIDQIRRSLKALKIFNRSASGILLGATTDAGSVDSPKCLMAMCLKYSNLFDIEDGCEDSKKLSSELSLLKDGFFEFNGMQFHDAEYCSINGMQFHGGREQYIAICNMIKLVLSPLDTGETQFRWGLIKHGFNSETSQERIKENLKENPNFTPELEGYRNVLKYLDFSCKQDGFRPPIGRLTMALRPFTRATAAIVLGK